MNKQALSESLNSIIRHYILPLGFFFFLSGILFFRSFSAYHTQIYLFFILPSCFLLVREWKQLSIIFSTRAFQLLLLLIFYAALSLLWNDPAISDGQYLKRLFIILLFIFAIVNLADDKQDKVIKLLLVSAGIYALAAYYSFFNDYILLDKPVSTRIVGMGNLSNPLLSSHIYGVFSVFIMAYFFTRKRNLKQDMLLIFIFIGLFSFVLLTHSRTPLLAFSCSSLFLLWIQRNKYTCYILALTGLIAIIFFTLNFDLLMQRGLSSRPEIWSITLDYIAQQPITGAGIGTGIEIYIAKLDTIFTNSHNIHLSLTFSLGLVGLLLWALLLWSLLLIYINNRYSVFAKITMSLLLYGICAGMTEGGSFFSRPKEVWFLTWLPIALILSIEYHQLRKVTANETA